MTTTAIVYPNVEPDERNDTALTETQRQRKANRSGRSADEITLWETQDDRANVRGRAYEDLGIKRVLPNDPSTAIRPGDTGLARPLDALGGDAIILAGGSRELNALAEKLGEDFIVTGNAPLLFPDAPGFTQNAAAIQPQPAGEPASFGDRYEASGVKAAHRKGQLRGRGIVCAVLDTGVDADHVDFAHRKDSTNTTIDFGFVLSEDPTRAPAEGRGFDLFGHGTHVCSIIGGRRGIAPNVGMVTAATVQTRLISNVVMFGIGLDWLLSRIEGEAEFSRRIVLNLSLGFPDIHDSDAPSDDRYEPALATFNAILDAIIDTDVLVVAAIGNRPNRWVSPADRSDVLSVGSVAGDLKRSPFSGHVPAAERHAHSGPRVMGFGQQVTGAQRRLASGDQLWVNRSGTSQAAAYVSGLAALYWAQKPSMAARDVASLIEETAEPLDRSDIRNGRGLARFDPKARA
jgi:subtilisin family serine protease